MIGRKLNRLPFDDNDDDPWILVIKMKIYHDHHYYKE